MAQDRHAARRQRCLGGPDLLAADGRQPKRAPAKKGRGRCAGAARPTTATPEPLMRTMRERGETCAFARSSPKRGRATWALAHATPSCVVCETERHQRRDRESHSLPWALRSSRSTRWTGAGDAESRRAGDTNCERGRAVRLGRHYQEMPAPVIEVRLDPPLLRGLRARADLEGVSLNELIRRLLAEGLKREREAGGLGAAGPPPTASDRVEDNTPLRRSA